MKQQDDEAWAFRAYENARARLPDPIFQNKITNAVSLAQIADKFDVFLLDAYGVLNIGSTAIEGVAERIRDLRSAGKKVMVVTNSAGYPKSIMLERFARLGYDFVAEDVVSSREAMLAYLANHPQISWGVMAQQNSRFEELEQLDYHILADNQAEFDNAEGFILIGSGEWTEQRQMMLTASIKVNPRPVLVGNPDIVAPREAGITLQPGHFAHQLANQTGISPIFFGKPFPAIYDMALARIGDTPDRDRILMVGDTLHTDILGGRNVDIQTALVSGFGTLANSDANVAIRQSGIAPNYIINRP